MDGSPILLGLRGGLTREQVGGKAASLARLVELGLPVPRAWVVPTEQLDAHVQALGLAPIAQAVEQHLRAGDRRAAEAAARHLRTAVQAAALPEALEDALRVVVETLPASGRLAVRSSATVEATRGASFAGQFETYLGVATLDEVSTALRAGWASLWAPGVLRYRAALQRDLSVAPRMAVLVQWLVSAEAAGACRANTAVADVEAVWGLGVGLTSGMVDPDAFRVTREGSLISTRLGIKAMRAEAVSGNTVWQGASEAVAAAPCLAPAAVCAVAGLAFQVSKAEGTPVELEWALADGTAWALQWRPSPPPAPVVEGNGEGDLQGVPASPGLATGRVVVVRDVPDLVRAGPGDVIAVRYFAPQLAPRFRGAAIVTEAGGTCSHGSVIARERGIPLVVSVPGATRRLRTGMIVRVDGATGTVSIVG
ncbi:MAG: pyruvate, phosphate dikinase [Chloroflexi bacterium]|nr:pyruvate, phosphate dikinase [Chloroflexota bacterium]